MNSEKKTRISSGQTESVSEKNEFLKLTHMSSPGQLQAAPRADTRYYTEQRLIFAEKRFKQEVTVTIKIGISWTLNFFLNLEKNSILSGQKESESEIISLF